MAVTRREAKEAAEQLAKAMEEADVNDIDAFSNFGELVSPHSPADMHKTRYTFSIFVKLSLQAVVPYSAPTVYRPQISYDDSYLPSEPRVIVEMPRTPQPYHPGFNWPGPSSSPLSSSTQYTAQKRQIRAVAMREAKQRQLQRWVSMQALGVDSPVVRKPRQQPQFSRQSSVPAHLNNEEWRYVESGEQLRTPTNMRAMRKLSRPSSPQRFLPKQKEAVFSYDFVDAQQLNNLSVASSRQASPGIRKLGTVATEPDFHQSGRLPRQLHGISPLTRGVLDRQRSLDAHQMTNNRKTTYVTVPEGRLQNFYDFTTTDSEFADDDGETSIDEQFPAHTQNLSRKKKRPAPLPPELVVEEEDRFWPSPAISVQPPESVAEENEMHSAATSRSLNRQVSVSKKLTVNTVSNDKSGTQAKVVVTKKKTRSVSFY